VVLSHDRAAGLIGVSVWCVSDLILLSLVFGDEGVPDSEEDVVDAFWGDWKLMLIPEAFFDASQNASLPIFHKGYMGHEAHAEVASVWAVLVHRGDVSAAPGAVVVMEVVAGDADFLWWWKVFDDPRFYLSCGSKVGAALWTCVHGDGDDFVRFLLWACGTVVPGRGTSFSLRDGPAGMILESLQ